VSPAALSISTDWRG